MGCIVSYIIGVTVSLVRRYGDVLLAYGKGPYQSTSTSHETLPVSHMLYYVVPQIFDNSSGLGDFSFVSFHPYGFWIYYTMAFTCNILI